MERPALQGLLADIRAGRIDIVVIYRVGRLTRSLASFVRLVEIFDAQDAAFVSVTQQFNTTTLMAPHAQFAVDVDFNVIYFPPNEAQTAHCVPRRQSGGMSGKAARTRLKNPAATQHQSTKRQRPMPALELAPSTRPRPR